MKTRSYFLPVVLMLLAACATLGVPTPQSFNQREAVAISSVAAIRDTATNLVQSGQITAADAQNILEQTDNARAAIVVADQIHATDPASADNRLTAILTGLNAIASYLASKGH